MPRRPLPKPYLTWWHKDVLNGRLECCPVRHEAQLSQALHLPLAQAHGGVVLGHRAARRHTAQAALNKQVLGAVAPTGGHVGKPRQLCF